MFFLFWAQNGQTLRKVVSDLTSEIDKLGKDLETIAKIEEEVIEVECDCCGLHEECTEDYIIQVKDSYSGRWICGLCSEAVKEKLNRRQNAIDEVLGTHKSFCQESRKNPKLSFTSAMREIAKRSSDNRKKNSSNIARSASCVPRFSLSS